jgi:exodeoxyribonuclease VII, large subunit
MEGIDRNGTATVPEGACTVGQLNKEIERALADAGNRFPSHVVGEVSEVSDYGFGTFFELRDPETDPSISCLAWSDAVASFDHDLTAGTEAVVEAEVDFYPDRGDCQLLVTDYWPLGESTRQQELEQLEAQLAGEGLFDESQKQSVPAHPDCIGLVTSPAGSAREDVQATVGERSPRTEIQLCGATVQGESAVPSLLDAVDTLDRDPEVEALVVTRGGGSDTDLWSFNAEPLVRRVAACSTPVVAAIGHEDDETLVEEAADARAMTPTEAGVVTTTPVEDLLEELAVLERRVTHGYRTLVESRLEALDRRVESAHETLTRRVQQRDAVRDRVRDLDRRIELAYGGLVAEQLDTLDRDVERGYRALAATRLDAIAGRLDTAMSDRELAAESEAARDRVARRRLGDLEARVDGAFRARVTHELDSLERRIDRAHREITADARVKRNAVRARRFRTAAVVLGALLVFLAVVAAVLLLAG